MKKVFFRFALTSSVEKLITTTHHHQKQTPCRKIWWALAALLQRHAACDDMLTAAAQHHVGPGHYVGNVTNSKLCQDVVVCSLQYINM